MTPRPGEPAWTEDDVEYVLEWQRMQDELCPGCGQPRHESMAKEAEGMYAATIQRCHACAESARAAETARKDGVEPEGLYISVHREH